MASIRFLVQLHVDEGHIPALSPLQAAPPAATITAPPPKTTVEPLEVAAVEEVHPQRTPPASTLSASEANSTLKMSGSGVQRRVAGVCPATPYTPLMMRHHRRPQSAALAKGGASPAPAAETMPRADSSGALVKPPVSRDATAPAETSSSHQRRSEFVDRWLEKLYFRNPVIVTQKKGDSQPSSPATPAVEDAHAPAVPPSASQVGFAQTRCRSADPSRGSVGQQLEVIHVANIRDDDEIVAQLPPKPIGVNTRDIRREMLEERFAHAFSRGPMSRPQSPAPRGPKEPRNLSQAVAASVSESSTALPSVSTFVERKRRVVA